MKRYDILGRASSLAGLLLLGAGLRAQTACDSLDLLTVWYAPFSDTAVEVTVLNRSSELFDYPEFRLADAAGDTLARETIFYFGISWNAPQVHLLDLVSDAQLPESPFAGSLALYFFGWQDTLSPCVYPMTFDLCPDSACITFQPYLYSAGNVPGSGHFAWAVRDDANVVRGQGLFQIDGNTQQDFGQLCLPPGHYTMEVTDNGDANGIFQFGVTRGFYASNGPSAAYVAGGDPDVLPFHFYAPCIESGNGIAPVVQAPFVLAVQDQRLQVRTADGTPIGAWTVMDMAGRTMRRGNSPGDRAEIGLQGMAAGTYVLRSERPAGLHVQRFVLVH